MTFSLDKSDPEVYIHTPESTDDILYQQLLYSKTDLSNTEHVLVMEAQPGSIAMFDYAEYTFDDSDESSPSTLTPLPTATASISPPPTAEHQSSSFPTGAVVGGVVGGVGGFFLALAVFFLCYARKGGLSRRLASGRPRWSDRVFVQKGIPLEPPKPSSSPTLFLTLAPKVNHVSGAVPADMDREIYQAVDPPPSERSQASVSQVPSNPGSLSLRLETLEVEVARLQEGYGTAPPEYVP